MKIQIIVNAEEHNLIAEFEEYGWLRIPEGIELVFDKSEIPLHIPVPVPVTGVSSTGTVVVPNVVSPTDQTISRPKGGFDVAFDWVIIQEGGYTNDPSDPGGETMYGIDTRDDKEHWQALGCAHIKDLTLAQAKIIYKEKYWDKYLCDEMPTPVAEAHFNYCVNVGSTASVRFIQESLGVKVDGQYGPITKEALTTNKNLKSVALKMVDFGDNYYRELANNRPANFAKDLKGWLNRNNSLRSLINNKLT